MHTVKDQKGLNDISLARSLDKSHAEQTEHILQTLNCHISTYLHLKTITIIYQLIEKAIDLKPSAGLTTWRCTTKELN
jgi:hypothetical protein